MEKQRLEQPVTQQQFEKLQNETATKEKLLDIRDTDRAERKNDKNEILGAISELRKDTFGAISELKKDIDKDFSDMKWWTIRTFGGLMILASSCIVGAIKLLPTAVQIVEKIPH